MFTAMPGDRGHLESSPNSERLHVWLAAAYAQSDRAEDAALEAEQVLVLISEFSIRRIERPFPFKDPAHLENFLEGSRKARLAK